MLKPAVDSATYFDKLYAYPCTDPTAACCFTARICWTSTACKCRPSFDEMKAACDKITAGEKNSKLACFAGQYNKYEGLTVNFDEAVHGAGGVIVSDDGKPNVATPEATQGLQTLTDWFKDGHIPKAAITWTEEEGRKSFQNGELIFHRNWPLRLHLCDQDRRLVQGCWQVRRCAAAWHHQPGVSSLGGANLRHRQECGEQGYGRRTSLSSWTSAESQKSDTLATSQCADS